MSGLFKFLRVLGVAGVILVLQAGAAWAEETTVRGVSSTLYAGGGALVVPRKETSADLYEGKRVGVAALGVWRFDAPRAEARNEEQEFFAAFGAGFELEDYRMPCADLGGSCFNGGPPSTRQLGKHVAARLGFGFGWRLFEFRLGVLGILPESRSPYAERIVLPDVLLRAGNRNVAWVELGVGAYDASTNLRPGLYLGGAAGSERVVRVSGHVGAHFVNGYCCQTLFALGYRYELGATRAFTDALSAGVGAALMSATDHYDDVTRFAAEGRVHLALAF